MRYHAVIIVVLLSMPFVTLGSIPEPSMVFYGTIQLGSQFVTASDDITVIARVQGMSQSLVGSYAMGDNANAQDNYVLPVRLETLLIGNTQSQKAAQIGQNIEFYLRLSDGTEYFAGRFNGLERGGVEQLNLFADGGPIVCDGPDLYNDGFIDMIDFHILATYWLEGCSAANNWCHCADINKMGSVDLTDLIALYGDWMNAVE